MGRAKLFIKLLVYIVVWKFNDVAKEAQGMTMAGHYEARGANEHAHSKDPPCAVCPRNGVCVPHVQCPAHVRPGSSNPQCHLEGTRHVGVCCSTGRRHAGESDRKFRSSINIDDMKTAHKQSREQLAEWLERADTLKDKHYAAVNSSDPSYWHHLSVRTYDSRAQMLGRGALLNMFAAQELKARAAITAEEIELGFTEHTDGPFCPPKLLCPQEPSRYRSIGGGCNNQNNPDWGATNTGFERLLPPDYSDGIWAMRTSRSGLPLPSARAVSNALLLDVNHPSATHNVMFMQFGQFIVHDISIGQVFALGDGNGISCCSGDGRILPKEFQHWACAPIVLDPGDIFYGQFGKQCINFVRAQLAPRSECSLGYAKQMNGASHYLDMSHLYGNSEEKILKLRAQGGLLSVFTDFGRDLPPLTKRRECLNMHEGAACFESGDNHGNQIISLTVLHAIWTREHNRIARALSKINPRWDEVQVFFESRRIMQAEYQHIIYNEWLPLLLGPRIMEIYGLLPSSGFSTSYHPGVDPSLTAEFSSAAMRFGHSTVDGQLKVLSPKHGGLYESISIPEVMFQPSRLRLKPFLDRMLIGMSWQPMQSVDPFITESLSRYMFHGGNPFGLDLAAINIQRGRDYGVRSYNEYRKLIGVEPLADFHQFAPSAAKRLSSVYVNPEDVDLWVGGLLEEPVEGGVIGPTFANIIADQFARLKNGDRYFYEFGPNINPGAFTPSQLAEIKKVTLSRIICDNSDGIELFEQSPNAFLRSDLPRNEPVRCDNPAIPAVDLSRFKEI
ncbi:chorion peroxidase [Vanessa atalanta]|uniref:chorion peroxidase n=1 Tax=Vanessa atalanta TaxID=42275 RepID=UPI001FCD8094|nr:chorion peroxidase [Vanessa atalanta]